MDVLGICAFDRAAAACLVRDGRVLAAVREDVLSGRLGDRSFPSHALAYCLRAGKIGPTALDLAVVTAPLDLRIPESAYSESARAVSSFAKRVGRWLGRRRVTLRDLVHDELDPEARTESLDGTLAEAAAAYFASPFGESVVLVIGESETTRWLGRDGTLEALGAPVNDVFAGGARARDETGVDALCVAGTGALDRARNASLRRTAGFDRFWVGPAPGGEAAAIGAALLGWRRASGTSGLADAGGEPRIGTALGPSYNAAQIRTFFRSQGISLEERGRDEAPLAAANCVANGGRIGWMDGRLDVGNEAASRAILRAPSPASPPDANRGEALAVAADRVADLFDVEPPCPFGLEFALAPAWRGKLADVRAPERPVPILPIASEHRGFRALLAAFERATGIPALVARPLRSPDRPVACAPADAWAVYAGASLDAIVMGSYVFPERPLTEGVASREIGAHHSTAPRSR